MMTLTTEPSSTVNKRIVDLRRRLVAAQQRVKAADAAAYRLNDEHQRIGGERQAAYAELNSAVTIRPADQDRIAAARSRVAKAVQAGQDWSAAWAECVSESKAAHSTACNLGSTLNRTVESAIQTHPELFQGESNPVAGGDGWENSNAISD